MARANYQVRQLLWKLIVATFVLMAIGSATRVMNAGLACPDWPLCYGTLIPAQQMNLQVFLEWIHRLDASLIGLMTMVLVAIALIKRQLLPKWVTWSAGLAFVLVCLQGALGAFTVTELLRFDIVTAHLGTALAFFALLLVMVIALTPINPVNPVVDNAVANDHNAASPMFLRRFSWLALGSAAIIYGQSLTGGLVGSQWALHQCLAIAQLCVVMNSHLLGVIPSTVGILVLVGWGWTQRQTLDPLVCGFSQITGYLLLLQIILGVATFRLHLQVELLTIAHQMTAAALFGSLVCLAVRSIDLGRSTAQSATTP
ncbi:MAG: heme A synthase [Cyanothece sp. SIO2G6]|nr:heme A synthase [Cyanothece sp. SIO2G6]